MVAGLGLYFGRYVPPYLKKIIFSSQTLVSIIVAVAVAAHPHIFRSYLSVDVIALFVNYNFMVFGFTIAALTIVFAVPTQRFVSFLVEAGERLPDKVTAPWEKALFIMSWNGFVHFCALVITIGIMITSFNYSDQVKAFIYDTKDLLTALVFGMAVMIQVYALLQFLSSLMSVYFFCAVFVAHAQSAISKK